MNKNVLCLIFAAFLTVACAQNQNTGLAVADGGHAVPVPANNGEDIDCVIVPIPADPECPDPANPPVNINITGGGTPGITVAPPFICVRKGEVVHFKINGPAEGPHKIQPGSVTVIPKNAYSSWLTGTNYPYEKVINIAVPSWLPDKSDHDYRVFIASDVCVDPRIHVR